MPSTRSRRYDDPVEDQPAEDPLINQPPQKQKQRSIAAGKSRLAAKTNPSEKSKNSRTRQTQKKKAARNTPPERGKEDSTSPSIPELEDGNLIDKEEESTATTNGNGDTPSSPPPKATHHHHSRPKSPSLVRISKLAMAKPASFTPKKSKSNLYRKIVGEKDKDQNDQHLIPVDASCAKKLNQLMAPCDLLGQLQRGSLTVPSVSVPVTTTATTTITAPSVPVPVTTTTPLTTSNTPSTNLIVTAEETNRQDNTGSFLGNIDVDGLNESLDRLDLGTPRHLFEQTATALPPSTGAIQTPARHDSLLAMHQQQASRPSTGRFGSANNHPEIPPHRTPARRRPKQTPAHRHPKQTPARRRPQQTPAHPRATREQVENLDNDPPETPQAVIDQQFGRLDPLPPRDFLPEEGQNQAIQRKRAYNIGKDQKIGCNATVFSHLKGKATEKKAGLVNSHFFDYVKMVTPTLIAADGGSTANWKKILPVLIQFDPYMPSNPKGGQRLAKERQRYERETEQVIISAASHEALDLWRDKMLDLLSGPDWKTSKSFDLTLVFDNVQADKARRGGINRRRKQRETNMNLSELIGTVAGDLVCETPLRS